MAAFGEIVYAFGYHVNTVWSTSIGEMLNGNARANAALEIAILIFENRNTPDLVGCVLIKRNTAKSAFNLATDADESGARGWATEGIF